MTVSLHWWLQLLLLHKVLLRCCYDVGLMYLWKTTRGSVCSIGLYKVEIHTLSTRFYHLVLKLIQGTMTASLHWWAQLFAFQLLIHNSADLTLEDNNGCSLLHKATQGGNTSIVNKVLSLGLEGDSRNNYGITPLIAAACCGKQSTFELLLQHGADTSLKDNLGNCLLHWTAQGGNTSIINKMLQLGLDVDSRSNAGTLQK